jgi:hypothetical protein
MTHIFVDEVETQLREKPLWGSQTQEFSNTHMYRRSGRTLISDV